MPNPTAFNVSLGSPYHWANGALNTQTSQYKGQSVTNLTTNASGYPVTFTVSLSHGNPAVTYTFAFTGGPTNGSVNITYPDLAGQQDVDSWDATATQGDEGDRAKAHHAK